MELSGSLPDWAYRRNGGSGPVSVGGARTGSAAGADLPTGAYKGAPYGLAIVVPLVTGPFNLGKSVVRARIEVDPHTAQLTISTDPLPVIIKGIPADLRVINAVIDKPGFMLTRRAAPR
jgi:hypothetical protein